ncbi:uncharacterized protein LOC120138990 [Hibiscus syriacus]|uniref:uncharacterized protein LOC120138990 n=1 Tax=Hibiscus syriacus TaxID=106335 RepID=UPI001920B0B4|nr:uncharacterized protein LOC120138990 [Hibiscus syriacus]
MDGLKLAWDIGTRSIEVESDNSTAVRTLKSPPLPSDSTIIRRIPQLLSLQWSVKFTFINRGKNALADALAKFGRSMELGLTVLEQPLTEVQELLDKDIDFRSAS